MRQIKENEISQVNGGGALPVIAITAAAALGGIVWWNRESATDHVNTFYIKFQDWYQQPYSPE